MAVTEVKGHIGKKDHIENYLGADYTANFLLEIKIKIDVAYKISAKRLQSSVQLSKPARPAVAKSLILTIEQPVRIRTDEIDGSAL